MHVLDIRGVEAALHPKKSKWKRLFSKLFEEPEDAATLKHVYEEDSGCQALHFVCGAPPQLSILSWPWLQKMFKWLVARFRCAVLQQSPHHTDKNLSADAMRASLLCWLLEKGEDLDFDSVNLRGEGPVHCCAMSGSPEVLRVILSLASTNYIELDLDSLTSCKDFAGLTPLDIAVATQNWECVRILCYYGALRSNSNFLEAKVSLDTAIHERPVMQDNPGGPGMISMLNSISVFLTDMLGSSKVRDLERMLVEAGQLGTEEHATGIQSGVEELGKALNESVSYLASRLEIAESEASALLVAHNYNEGAAVEAFTKDRRGAAESAGLQYSSVAAAAPRDSDEPCIVCFETLDPSLNWSVHLPCGHGTCDDCWRGIMQARMDDGDVHHTICPFHECKLQVPQDAAEQLLSASQYARFQELLVKRYADSNPAIRWCPQTDCGNSLILDSRNTCENGLLHLTLSGRPVSVQCLCRHRFCWTCLGPAHEPASCKQVKEWNVALKQVHEDNEFKSNAWLTKQTQSCPKCHAHIERNGGCNHMICTVCQQHFCYKCGQDWVGHADYYNCTMSTDSPSDKEDPARPGSSSPHKTAGGIMATIIRGIKNMTDEYYWKWYIKQFAAQECNFEDIRRIGFYMSVLLYLGCPRGDERICHRADDLKLGHNQGRGQTVSNAEIQRKENSTPSCSCAGEVELRSMYTTIKSMADAVCLSREVLQYSYILASKMDRDAKKRFLDHMQANLYGAVEQLSFLMASFPGFRQVVGMVFEVTGMDEDAIKDVAEQIPLVSDVDLLRAQFSYCMALASLESDLQRLTIEVNHWRRSIIQSARLGILYKLQTDKKDEAQSGEKTSGWAKLGKTFLLPSK